MEKYLIDKYIHIHMKIQCEAYYIRNVKRLSRKRVHFG
nr:MAG TPA: hypothetical protein [Caudoviricetes sp.]DAW66080.1 MAG TPA: hypothetical protein [Caudoviricetes sp.]